MAASIIKPPYKAGKPQKGRYPTIDDVECSCEVAEVCGESKQEAEATRDFIILACNNHEALLTALKDLLPHVPDGANDEADAALATARAVIAKAEGN